MTLQDAVLRALESWASQLPNAPIEPLDALEGSLADVDIEKLLKEGKRSGVDQGSALVVNS